jgi:hypothetical protein
MDSHRSLGPSSTRPAAGMQPASFHPVFGAADVASTYNTIYS